ncbi:putative lipoprotein [Myxococcus hansupus]|uniref:Putative lipoprotein n=1 Tax=Pseudomyxococcus hansupus TaxID=1297742 RepID=A0A0H4X3K7_9BACT|nr:putative lipoprotein [Myxococcus hansupus]
MDSGTADAGTEPWDGTAIPLEEHGNRVDEGPYAPCAHVGNGAQACETLEPSGFDLSACDPAALAQVPSVGIYRALTREVRGLTDGGTEVSLASIGFGLWDNGEASTLSNQPLVTQQTGDGQFFLAMRRATPPLGASMALAGCQAPKPGVITGCYVRCNQGAFSRSGTFEAHRMTWPEGESESSGGLTLRAEAPVSVGGMVADVYVTKAHAYVVSISQFGVGGGLTVFDVSDPAHPVFKTSIHIPGDSYWNGVWAQGDALYIASSVSGVIVYDITEPGAPAFIRSLPSGLFGVHTVLVHGERLYTTNNEGRTDVFDVRVPLEPVQLTSIALAEEYSFGGPHDLFVHEDRLYISNAQGGYSIMDISDLEDVRHLGQYSYPDVYSHHSAVGTFAGRTIAFEGGEFESSHLRVLDVTDPANIVKIGEHRKRPATSIHNLILQGDRLYIAWYHEGLRVLDVSNPTRPREVAHFNTYRETDPGRTDGLFQGAFGVRVPGDGFIYVAESARGLLIFEQP